MLFIKKDCVTVCLESTIYFVQILCMHFDDYILIFILLMLRHAYSMYPLNQ